MITEIGREPTHHPRSPPVVAVLRCVWTMASSRAPRHSLTGGGRATKGRRRAHLHILGGGGILRRIEAGGEHISGGGGIAVDSCSTHRVSNNPLQSILLQSSFTPVRATASCLLGVAHKPTAHPAILAPPVAWHCLEPTKWTIPVLHGMLHTHAHPGLYSSSSLGVLGM
jgi:hypothetical protein